MLVSQLKMSLKQEVLSLYRQLLRVARSWEAKAPNDTQVERDYIKSETKRLFRQNQKVQCYCYVIYKCKNVKKKHEENKNGYGPRH